MRRLLVCLALALLTACAAPTTPGPSEPTRQSPRAPVAEGGMCGGFAGFQCQSGLTCQMEAGVCGRVADAAGVCRKAPRACTRIYQPVCGCDGKTYGNACEAGAAGIGVSAQGACKAK